jgi:hypothetical protein
MSICLLDTSVFCNIVAVPGKCQQADEVRARLNSLIRDRTTFLLPMISILETGNHIGQVSDGSARREAAIRFVAQVQGALNGLAPWWPTPFVRPEDLRSWLSLFPDSAKQKCGLGDLVIIQEWERQRALHPIRRVFIWSFDQHLHGYDTGHRI